MPAGCHARLENNYTNGKKIAYINSLLKIGFDTIDFGSFVSPKSIPQMFDTKEVIRNLELAGSSSKLLAIVANTRGAEAAISYDQISYLGFPFPFRRFFSNEIQTVPF